MFGCQRKSRLNQLREIRRLRDQINAADNEGIARKLLFQIRYTDQITITSGGWMKTRVYFQMRDGWEDTVSSLFTLDAIKEANQVIYKRLSQQFRKGSL
ncbi:hypothetical protein [Gimesia chilikensis]|uniref:hypothetical protein n=1 Tax=Gimesia chilikensis TaxID=2605989 RepID=UPI003A91889D